MNTMMIHRTESSGTARRIRTARTVRPAIRLEPAANTATAIERQLDEIQHTFGVRWEW